MLIVLQLELAACEVMNADIAILSIKNPLQWTEFEN